MSSGTVKKCPHCGMERLVSDFYADKSKRSGLSTYCKKCTRFKKEQRRKNSNNASRTYNGRPCKICGTTEKLSSNKSCVKCSKERERKRSGTRDRSAYYNEWAKGNADKIKSYHDAYRRKNSTNDEFKLKSTIRSMVTRCAGSGRTICRLGYSHNDLKLRIEAQFKRGMSWDNYGEWEIDHKIPIHTFMKRGERRVEIINALANLQPLWMSENRRKGARYVG